jgi:hypothetical protein
MLSIAGFGNWFSLLPRNTQRVDRRKRYFAELLPRGLKELIDVAGFAQWSKDRFRLEFRFKRRAVSFKRIALSPATVYQELRVLRRMLNVAVRKKLLPANPCFGVEFPVKVNGLFRPHYMTWSEHSGSSFRPPIT